MGGWLTHGDLALDSCAQFLAVAEHRLIPSGARSVCHQLRRAGHHSVWSPACQDHVAGGHGMEWILMEVSRLRSGRLSKQKKNYPFNAAWTSECSWRATVAPYWCWGC